MRPLCEGGRLWGRMIDEWMPAIVFILYVIVILTVVATILWSLVRITNALASIGESLEKIAAAMRSRKD
jgi:hypothetical protein